MEKPRRNKQALTRLKHLDTTWLWHPFTQMQDYSRSEPLIIERGKGSYLYDIDGNYIHRWSFIAVGHCSWPPEKTDR